MDGARNLPPEVSAALGRFRMGADDDRDRSVLQSYLDSGQADPAQSAALQQILDAMSSGGNQVSPPSLGDAFGNFLSWGDQSRNFQGGSQVLPTNPPQPSGGIDLGQTSWNAGRDKLPSTIGLNQPQPQIAPANLPTPAPPGMPAPLTPPSGTIPPLPAAPRLVNKYGQADRREARAAIRGPAIGGGPTNWKGIEGAPGGSAFGDVNPNYLTLVAGSPDLAATMLAEQGLPEGRHAPATAAAMAPQVGSALAMAKSGLLGGGGRGHGLGGPASSRQQLSRAEGLITSLGPGASIDPAYVYSKGLRMARKTPLADLGGGDIEAQIATTQDAILKPLKGLVDEDAYTATANMLAREAMTWAQGVANGEIDPNLLSYPEWIRRQKKQHYLGR